MTQQHNVLATIQEPTTELEFLIEEQAGISTQKEVEATVTVSEVAKKTRKLTNSTRRRAQTKKSLIPRTQFAFICKK